MVMDIEWMRAEIERLGLRLRRAHLEQNSESEWMLEGMLQALGDVLVHHGQDETEVGRWIDAAKGSDS